jgi:hypothetical protein
MAAHQRDRVAHLETMKHMKANASGETQADVDLINEQTLRDAKQQGLQGNIAFGKDGRARIVSEYEMGGSTDKYAWGQNEKEVHIKCLVPAGTKSRGVQMTTTSETMKLLVLNQVICSGRLHKPILSDESLFALEDAPGDPEGRRMLTVTLTKREETKGANHWPCAIKGEGKISTKDFGVPVTTVNPNDPAAMKAVIEQLNESNNKA